MKRLFCVKDSRGKIVLASKVDDGFWTLKAEAKKFRNSLNEETFIPHHKSTAPYHVSIGHDHWRNT